MSWCEGRFKMLAADDMVLELVHGQSLRLLDAGPRVRDTYVSDPHHIHDLHHFRSVQSLLRRFVVF